MNGSTIDVEGFDDMSDLRSALIDYIERVTRAMSFEEANRWLRAESPGSLNRP